MIILKNIKNLFLSIGYCFCSFVDRVLFNNTSHIPYVNHMSSGFKQYMFYEISILGDNTQNYQYMSVANGCYHNFNDKPAVKQIFDGNIRLQLWYKHGLRHRIDNPAVILYYNTNIVKERQWWFNDQLHNTTGPAIIKYNESGDIEISLYLINGNELSFIEWIEHPKNELELSQRVEMKMIYEKNNRSN